MPNVVDLTAAQVKQLEQFEEDRKANDVCLASAMRAFQERHKEIRRVAQPLWDDLAVQLGTTMEILKREGKDIRVNTAALTASIIDTKPVPPGGTK